MSKQLPDKPSMDHLRKQAKELIASYRNGEQEAIERFKKLPEKTGRPALHDAQSVIAREYGLESWQKLVRHVEEVNSRRGITDEIANQFLAILADKAQGSIARLLELYPQLPSYNAQIAIACANADYLRTWLSSHPIDEKLPPYDWQPLEYVCYSPISKINPDKYAAQEECARMLLDAGADPNTGRILDPKYGPLPVLYGACCHAQHEGIARLLLERGAKTNDGESVYHSTQLNLRNMLALLEEFGADFSEDNEMYHNTALYFNAGHRPSDSGYENAMGGMEWLLEHGTNPNVKSYECRETPLFPAVRNGNLRLVNDLIEHGADVNVKNDKGISPYMLAAVTGAADVMEALSAAGADTALPDPGPFLADCAAGRIEKVRAALAADPDIISRLNDREKSVICKMAELGRTIGVRTCLEAGFPVDTRGDENATPLHFACYCQWDETASLLIKAGAPLEVRDSTYDGTPLAWVLEGFCYNRNTKGNGVRIVKELLAAGASDENLKQRLEHDADNPGLQEVMAALGM